MPPRRHAVAMRVRQRRPSAATARGPCRGRCRGSTPRRALGRRDRCTLAGASPATMPTPTSTMTMTMTKRRWTAGGGTPDCGRRTRCTQPYTQAECCVTAQSCTLDPRRLPSLLLTLPQSHIHPAPHYNRRPVLQGRLPHCHGDARTYLASCRPSWENASRVTCAVCSGRARSASTTTTSSTLGGAASIGYTPAGRASLSRRPVEGNTYL